MTVLRLLAAVLIIAGTVGLVHPEYSYTKEQHEAEFAGMSLSLQQRETITVPQWLSVGAIAIGLAGLLFAARR